MNDHFIGAGTIHMGAPKNATKGEINVRLFNINLKTYLFGMFNNLFIHGI